MMAGDVEIPGSEPVRWQYSLMGQDIIEHDWTELTSTIDALAHPARLTIVRLVLKGVKSTAELLEQDTLGTTGQIHHHLRQLIPAGWLVSSRRGLYEVPVHRVVHDMSRWAQAQLDRTTPGLSALEPTADFGA